MNKTHFTVEQCLLHNEDVIDLFIYWFIHLCCYPEVQMYLCNKERYGYLNVPAKPHHTLEDDRLNFVHVHLESLSKNRLYSLLILIKLRIIDHCPGLCYIKLCPSLLTPVSSFPNSWWSSNAPLTICPYVPQTERPHGLRWGERHPIFFLLVGK